MRRQLITLSVAFALFALAFDVPSLARQQQAVRARPGEALEFGKTYVVGKINPVHLTIHNAEYTDRIDTIDTMGNKGENSAGRGWKLLLVHISVHNPNATDLEFFEPGGLEPGESAFHMVVVLQDGRENDSANYLREGDHQILGKSFKYPAQHLVKAKQTVKTVVVFNLLDGDSAAALRVNYAPFFRSAALRETRAQDTLLTFDTRGKIKGLAGALADSSDASGATIAHHVPLTIGGDFAPMSRLSVRLEALEWADAVTGLRAPQDRYRFLVATLTLKNRTTQMVTVNEKTVFADVRRPDGGPRGFYMVLLRADRDRKADMELNPEGEARVRAIVEAPRGEADGSFVISEGVGVGRMPFFDLRKMTGSPGQPRPSRNPLSGIFKPR